MILNSGHATDSGAREERLTRLVALLKARGHRITRQRETVLRALVFSDRHPAIDELYRESRRTLPNISLATVYKVIDALRQHGEVLELSYGNNEGNRYDGFRPEDHPHFTCVSCGAIADLQLSSLAHILDEVFETERIQVERYRFDLFGTCPQCQQTEV